MAKRLFWADLPSDFSKQQRIWAIWYARKKRKRISIVLFNLKPLHAGQFVRRKTKSPIVAWTYSHGWPVDPPIPLNDDYSAVEAEFYRVWVDYEDYWKTPIFYAWGKFRSLETGDERWLQIASYELPRKKWPGLNHQLLEKVEFRDKKGYLKKPFLVFARIYTRETWRPRKKSDPALSEAKKPF